MKKLTALFILVIFNSHSQSPSLRFKEGLKIYLNDDSTRYIKAMGLAQIWLRYNDNNPGTTVFGTPQSQTFDVGLRRVRYQVLAQVTKKVFFYTHFGINSFNSISARKTPLFFHDVTAEYNIYKNYFTLGAGLHGWNGTGRYSSSAAGNILCVDFPIIEETTNDITDQFVRKLGVYAKGKMGGFDYRLSVSNPLPIQTALTPVATLPSTGNNVSFFSTRAPELQYSGYFMWQFLDKENNQVPYMTGSYLGKKRMFNIGAGFNFQNNAMWYRNNNNDTISTALTQFGVDVFYDAPLNVEKQNAITIYASFLNYDFGPNYIRNIGIMNMANGTNANGTFSGAGNSIPLIGTGQVIYVQAGYLFKHDLLKSCGTLQPYISGSYASYQRLKDPVVVYDIGVNWLMNGHNSKITIDYQSRPVFNTDSNFNLSEILSARRGMIVLQYQVLF